MSGLDGWGDGRGPFGPKTERNRADLRLPKGRPAGQAAQVLDWRRREGDPEAAIEQGRLTIVGARWQWEI
jgi:hypothetical protein